jgi:methoxymalonate biosynthesis acyl carrier protein
MEQRTAKIREFLARFLQNHQLAGDDDIFRSGLVNSLVALQLVNFLQKEFDISIEDDDLDFENFRTLNNMNRFVERKKSAVAAGAPGSK